VLTDFIEKALYRVLHLKKRSAEGLLSVYEIQWKAPKLLVRPIYSSLAFREFLFHGFAKFAGLP